MSKSFEDLQEEEYKKALIKQRINNLANNWNKATMNAKKMRKRII